MMPRVSNSSATAPETAEARRTDMLDQRPKVIGMPVRVSRKGLPERRTAFVVRPRAAAMLGLPAVVRRAGGG